MAFSAEYETPLTREKGVRYFTFLLIFFQNRAERTRHGDDIWRARSATACRVLEWTNLLCWRAPRS